MPIRSTYRGNREPNYRCARRHRASVETRSSLSAAGTAYDSEHNKLVILESDCSRRDRCDPRLQTVTNSSRLRGAAALPFADRRLRDRESSEPPRQEETRPLPLKASYLGRISFFGELDRLYCFRPWAWEVGCGSRVREVARPYCLRWPRIC
jgi:hypothetical protein